MSRQDSSASRTSYSFAQIVLHWAIAALVGWQLFAGNDPPRPRPAMIASELWTSTLESSHLWVGLLILALVAVRVGLRMARGVPEAIPGNRIQATMARVVHGLFYGLLIFMPVTGILTWYFGLPLGDIHEAAKPAFVALIAAHAAAALWHQFIRRDGLMRRMLVPAR